MKTIISKIFIGVALVAGFGSCADFFEPESDHVVFADQDHLGNATDTLYSVAGILNKLQAIGDRTILLGEARGDLMDVTDATSADLRQLALFEVDDDNMYNVPRDYYAVINNCNYFIAKADTAMKNNRNEYLFRGEFALVKAIRAWTYLQLVTTYGRVPFVTEPILTKADAEKDYPMYGIQEVCSYFLDQDGLKEMADYEYLVYGKIREVHARLLMMPMYLVLGDLNLWAGRYMDAATCYYNYISKRNGKNSSYPVGTSRVYWMSNSWISAYGNRTAGFRNEELTQNNEVITMIAGDSIPSEGYYSQLRNIFNTSSDNDYAASLVPSQSLKDLSAAQVYCYNESDSTVTYAPTNLPKNCSGDLRLVEVWTSDDSEVNPVTGQRYDYQYIAKYSSRHIHIYRRQMVYLRMAEALNRAGYPHFAFAFLKTGVNNKILNDSIIPHYTADSLKLAQFDFPNTRYILADERNVRADANTLAIHSRGSGYSIANSFYQMPYNPALTDSLEQIAWQQEEVENLLMDENALELAFEGTRYYDLLRVALRRNDPAYLADRIYARSKNGTSGITTNLRDQKNWFLNWKGQIGY